MHEPMTASTPTVVPTLHAEIQYLRPGEGYIHSDVCWHAEDVKNPVAEWAEYRKIAHQLLDEFLDKYAVSGDGMFYLSNDLAKFTDPLR